jgi:hypothetical protein
MNGCRLLALASLAFLAVPVAMAQSSWDHRAELTPFIGFRLGGSFEESASGSRLELNESASYGLIFDHDLDGNAGVEFLFSRQSTDLLDKEGIFQGDTVFAIDVDYYHTGGLYQWDGRRVRPFIAGSLGLTRMAPELAGLDTEYRFSLGLGGGVKLFASRHVGFRLEGRGFTTFMSSSGSIFCGGSGCLVEVQASAVFQFEVSAGLILAF